MYQPSPNKLKPDPRLRFQRHGFRRQLEQARNYKRAARKIPDQSWELFLSKIGLRTWWAKLGLFFIIILIGSVIYYPGFFFVRDISVVGLKSQEAVQIESSIKLYFQAHKAWPQQNLLLLDTLSLKKYISTNNMVAKISNISKKYFHSLVITVEPRLDTFVLQANGKFFIIANDGTVTNSNFNATSSIPSTLIPITIKNGQEPVNSKEYLDIETLDTVKTLNFALLSAFGSKPAYFELEEVKSQDLAVFMPVGFKILFDIKSNPQDDTGRLRLILADVPKQDWGKLAYVDVRLKNRGYSCYKSAACAKEDAINLTATSTQP